MKMLKGRRVAAWTAAAVAAVAVGIGAASYASPWRTLDKIVSAAERGQTDRLRELVDWDSVRDRNTERVAKEEIAKAGLAPGDERINDLVMGVHGVVSKVATPENVALAAKSGALDSATLRIKGRYMGVGVFVFAVENVKTKNAMSLRLRRLGPMSWRLDDAALIDARLLGGQ